MNGAGPPERRTIDRFDGHYAVVLAEAADMEDGPASRRLSSLHSSPADRSRWRTAPFVVLQEFAKEALRSECATAALNQDVEHLAGVIDGPPEPAALPLIIRQSSQDARC